MLVYNFYFTKGKSMKNTKTTKQSCPIKNTLKEHRKLILALVAAFLVGFCFKALISPSVKVAVVDVQKIVSNSKDMAELQQSITQVSQELQEWLTTVRADLEKQKNRQKKDELTKKYNEEFAQKQQAIQENYNEKLSQIDEKINQIIAQTAKKEGYKITLFKTSVLNGGTDITDKVIEQIK